MAQGGDHSDDIQKLIAEQKSAEPKNPKLSVHNQYKRRLRRLSLCLSDFIFHAEQKLDGNIYKREEIEKVLAKAKELATLLPTPDNALDCPAVRDDLLEILQSGGQQTDAILDNANKFFAELSKEDWDELIQSYATTNAARKPGG